MVFHQIPIVHIHMMLAQITVPIYVLPQTEERVLLYEIIRVTTSMSEIIHEFVSNYNLIRSEARPVLEARRNSNTPRKEKFGIHLMSLMEWSRFYLLF